MCGDDDDVLFVCVDVERFECEFNYPRGKPTTWSNPGFCYLVQSGKCMLEPEVKNVHVQAPR
jgi:hypothetical protein